jgi:hypothetical protein
MRALAGSLPITGLQRYDAMMLCGVLCANAVATIENETADAAAATTHGNRELLEIMACLSS